MRQFLSREVSLTEDKKMVTPREVSPRSSPSLPSAHQYTNSRTIHKTQSMNIANTDNHPTITDTCHKRSTSILSKTNHRKVFFLPRGITMSKQRIAILKTVLEKKNTGSVEMVSSWVYGQSASIPDYIVVDATLSADLLCAALGFPSIEKMAEDIQKSSVYILNSDWVKRTNLVDEPTLTDCWYGFHNLKRRSSMKQHAGVKRQLPGVKNSDEQSIAIKHTKSVDGGNNAMKWMTRNRKCDEFARVTKVKACDVENDVITKQLHKRIKFKHQPDIIEIKDQRAHNDDDVVTITQEKKNVPFMMKGDRERKRDVKNIKISEMLKDISEVYHECPIDPMDEWRSYSYRLVSGRVKYLDFHVTNDSESLHRLSLIRGFGKKVMKQITEYLQTGKCPLLCEFKRDPTRVSFGNMLNIWGVGPKGASDLIQLGYTDIESVRRDVKNLKLTLEPNVLVGVEFYEDFQERMTREEVKQMGGIVKEAVKERFPGADVVIMGSYRRGKETCGDIDILIVHQKYVTSTPEGALDDLVERLKKRGYITHHLTSVSTKNEVYEQTTHSQYSQRQDGEDDTYSCSDFDYFGVVRTTPKSQSYMGVFRSPLFPEKHRRIDIKFYPYREKAFASLYFTGSGHHNRSMRLYAKKRRQIKLDDHGIKDYLSGARKFEAKTERGIYDYLGLEYREPHQREGSVYDTALLNSSIPNEKDIKEELRHKWIN